MKNIHILPTEKESNLAIIDGKILEYDPYVRYLSGIGVDGIHTQNQNIYITSDEEIKEGDWIYHSNKEKIFQVNSNKAYSGTQNITLAFVQKYDTCKKIILTTDQDLIKDGVQAINDEFLEWFVKNPSCESVEMDLLKRGIYDEYKYNIIIPKEEPKQCDICKMYPRLEGTNKCESCYSVVRHVLEQDPRFKDTLLPDLRKKQETLEEAIKKYPLINQRIGFKLGIKWQQEQDKNKYSEEDLISLLEFNYKKETNQLGTLRKDYSQKIVREWFEQFKNK